MTPVSPGSDRKGNDEGHWKATFKSCDTKRNSQKHPKATIRLLIAMFIRDSLRHPHTALRKAQCGECGPQVHPLCLKNINYIFGKNQIQNYKTRIIQRVTMTSTDHPPFPHPPRQVSSYVNRGCLRLHACCPGSPDVWSAGVWRSETSEILGGPTLGFYRVLLGFIGLLQGFGG